MVICTDNRQYYYVSFAKNFLRKLGMLDFVKLFVQIFKTDYRNICIQVSE